MGPGKSRGRSARPGQCSYKWAYCTLRPSRSSSLLPASGCGTRLPCSGVSWGCSTYGCHCASVHPPQIPHRDPPQAFSHCPDKDNLGLSREPKSQHPGIEREQENKEQPTSVHLVMSANSHFHMHTLSTLDVKSWYSAPATQIPIRCSHFYPLLCSKRTSPIQVRERFVSKIPAMCQDF